MRWMILLALSACSLFQSGPKGDFTQYINPDPNQLAPTDEIRAALSRIGYLSGGEYEFKITPYTLSLITAETRDLQRLRGFDEVERREIERQRRIELIDGKVCVEVDITVVRFKEASKISDWEVELISPKDQAFPMRWRDSDLKRPAVQTFFTGLYGQEAKWYNQGVACTNVEIDLAQGFHVRLKPNYVQWPFSANTSMTWGLQELTFQPYRGY